MNHRRHGLQCQLSIAPFIFWLEALGVQAIVHVYCFSATEDQYQDDTTVWWLLLCRDCIEFYCGTTKWFTKKAQLSSVLSLTSSWDNFTWKSSHHSHSFYPALLLLCHSLSFILILITIFIFLLLIACPFVGALVGFLADKLERRHSRKAVNCCHFANAWRCPFSFSLTLLPSHKSFFWSFHLQCGLYHCLHYIH